MGYTTLSLTQFRSYERAQVSLNAGVNIIVGPNGSGKTNLLEAIYVLSRGTSFRVADKDLIRDSEEWFRLEGAYDEQQRAVSYQLERKPPKQFSLDGVKRHRLTYQQKVPLVLFEPNELRLLSGAPQRRRDYIDSISASLWPEASIERSRFERALLQRNNILRQAAERPYEALEDVLFVWDIKLAEYAAKLVERRHKLIDVWNSRIGSLYSAIAGKPYTVEVLYRSDIATNAYKATLLRHLAARRAGDMLRGFTSSGPHRDEYAFLVNGAEASRTASRGELRTLILALKMIELELLAEMHARRPILLLDDVFSELDTSRRSLLADVAKGFQTIITTTDADMASKYFSRNCTVITAGSF
jgi:DNA replication and repair protein RecF